MREATPAGRLIHELAERACLYVRHTPDHFPYERRRRYERTPGAFIERLSPEKREILKTLRSNDVADVRPFPWI